MITRRLSRRRVLRSLGATGLAVGLPPLEAMQDGRGRWYQHADAAATAPPLRFVLFLFSNGVASQTLKPWTPMGEGPSYTLSPALEPLGDLRSRVTVVTGLRHTAYFASAGSGEHGKANASLLTGLGAPIGGSAATTLDQTLARAWTGQTPVASLQAICDPGSPPTGDARPISTCWAGPKQPLPPVEDPALYFKRLFGSMPGGPMANVSNVSTLARELRYRRSVLDHVRADAAGLKRLLGAEDNRRLDRHLELVRELENQLAPSQPAGGMARQCPAPQSLTALTGEARIKAMVELTALALQCDLTRVAVLQYGYPFGNATFPWLNISGGDHNISHSNDAAFLAPVKYKVQTFAHLLRLMDAVKEGERSLLGNSVVLGTSDVGLGSHNTTQHGVVIGGTAGGQWRTGHHLVHPAGTPLNRLMLAILQTLKMPVARFGMDGDQPLAGLT